MKNLPSKTWHLFLLLLLVGVGLSPASIAHTADVKISPDIPLRLIRLDPQVRKRYIPPPVEILTNANMSASANIVVNYNGSGWTTQAVEAFEFAVAIWESLITSPVTIMVEASFEPLGGNILGGAGPVTMVSGFPNAPLGNTWYPVAVANKLAGSDLDNSSVDIVAEFSSNFLGWHFGTGSSTPGDKISFVSVVLHELGHGLGFLGSMEAGGVCGNPNWGCYGIGGDPYIYDRFVENGVILSTVTRRKAIHRYLAKPGGTITDVALAVLINGGSGIADLINLASPPSPVAEYARNTDYLYGAVPLPYTP